MASRETELIVAELEATLAAVREAAQSERFVSQVAAISREIVAALRGGGKVLIAGNGGSAADAQHISGELLSRLNRDRAPFAAFALAANPAVLTAIANDFGYGQVFARQVAGLGRPGDIFIGLSTSGRSQNILLALAKARELGLRAVGFTGRTGGKMAGLCDLLLNAPSDSPPIIQQIHITAAHIICGLVESAYETSAPSGNVQ
jgi:D-sedoheptulose 7-phosphate isomerase